MDVRFTLPAGTAGSIACSSYCLTFDIDIGYNFFGLQFTNECWCSKELNSDVNHGDCNLDCPDGSGEKCGGSYSMDVYFLHEPAADEEPVEEPTEEPVEEPVNDSDEQSVEESVNDSEEEEEPVEESVNTEKILCGLLQTAGC